LGERLLRPTVALVEWYSAQFSAGDAGMADAGLRRLVDAFPHNSELSDVLLKVAAINAIYATNIYAIFPVARHIRDLQIDARLAKRDPTLVSDIAAIQIAGKHRFNYSFASKYCAWHVPEAYTIYDSYVDWLLWRYQVEEQFFSGGFRRYELRDYSRFIYIHQAFRSHFSLERLALKEVDHFLWLYGQKAMTGAADADGSAPLSGDV